MSENEQGACAVCEQPARLRCGNCKTVFYCNKDHQRSDWSRHKSTCRSWEERENEELGRYLIAARDLNPGDLIISEPPIVWGPIPHTTERVCVGCGSKDAALWCQECAWPACHPQCNGLFDEDRHGFECNLLAKARILPKCGIILAMRMLILRRKNPKRWKALTKLQSHDKFRGPGTEAYEEMQLIAESLGPLLALDPTAGEALTKVCGLIDVNALETNPPEGSAAIYETACLLEHCCIANTRHTFSFDAQGRPRINVIAVTAIKKGDHLSTTYTHVLWSTRARREHLLATKYFSCRCERCSDPTELGSHLGSLKCPCEKGYVIPIDPLKADTDWSCDSCPGILSASEVAQLTDRLGEEVEAAMSVPVEDIISDLLFRLKVLLHPTHQHCINLSHSLMQLLPANNPKKAEVCRGMIDVIKIVDPYESRLALYHAVALRELAKCLGEDRNGLLNKAADLLNYEPPNSPGGSMKRLILSEI